MITLLCYNIIWPLNWNWLRTEIFLRETSSRRRCCVQEAASRSDRIRIFTPDVVACITHDRVYNARQKLATLITAPARIQFLSAAVCSMSKREYICISWFNRRDCLRRCRANGPLVCEIIFRNVILLHVTARSETSQSIRMIVVDVFAERIFYSALHVW